MSSPVEAFLERSRAAVQDAFLQTALDRATSRLKTARANAFVSLPDAEAVRDQAKAIKAETIAHLDHYLARLAEQVEMAGGRIHWAADGEEAKQIVLHLAREKGVRSIVKSKSMASEEIHLNAALEAAGLRVVETDLGEYIVQMAKETPSHIIAPAIHKTKEQIAELFSGIAGRALPPDPDKLTAWARERLRQEFLQADMGISGANFAIAETGTIVIVTNEGNGRLVTTMPRIHVAIIGMEKVIPAMADLPLFLEVLARSATGQKMSVYTTLIRGPRRPGEVDGPDEFHLVIMDNGRRKALGGPLEESLQCLRCGSCLNVCPVYGEAGGHAYGSVYPGPIGIIVSQYLGGPGHTQNLGSASTLCAACLDACPVKIDIPRMLLDLREDAQKKGEVPRTEKMAFGMMAKVMASPALYRLAVRAARRLLGPFVRNGRVERLPGRLAGWTRFRTLPPIAEKTFRDRWRGIERASQDG
jgi:L-lactate dehydrogenase complex protein LldF